MIPAGPAAFAARNVLYHYGQETPVAASRSRDAATEGRGSAAVSAVAGTSRLR